jgi:NAD(P)-dependent dehydrogenase (short-subunit alcohol dehydrogenase family)
MGNVLADGHTALITGASGGLGQAVVAAFRDAGARVIGLARSAPADDADWIRADLTDAAGARNAVSEAWERAAGGRVDSVVHILGGFAGGKTVAETDDAAWHGMLNLNLNAAFYVLREAAGRMAVQGRGRILAVGSRTGVAPAAGLAAYSVSKAALNALVQTLALELKDTGVTANVVLPGVIDTGANRSWGSAEEAARWVKPESIAEVLVWLASAASRDVNGALIPVYGRS